MTALDNYRRAVEAKMLKTANDHGASFMHECPVHDDNNPSVSVTYSNEKVLVRCHGCEADAMEITAALDLTLNDLFDGEPDRRDNKVQVAEYRYTDADGNYLFSKFRYFPKTFLIGIDQGTTVNWRLPRDMKPWLFRAPKVKQALDDGEVIYIVEGEKDVLAVEAMGAVATTQPHGAGRDKWWPWHSSVFTRATDVRIIRDRDDAGVAYSQAVFGSLLDAGVKNVTVWEAKEGKDAYDHRAAGYTLDDLVRIEDPQERAHGIHGHDLLDKEFPPLVFAVEPILPQGVAILAGSPKSGKSWVSLDMAMGVASGGRCMSELHCTRGDVLYIGLEDSERRLRDRIELLSGGERPDISRVEFQTIDSGWIGGETGLEWMHEWAQSVEDPRLVVIDTLRKAEPHLDESRNQYVEEQETMLRYKRFADRHDLTVLLVHHNNKSTDSEDWMDRFSGTKGLTGGADTLLYLDYKRGERDGFLRVDGRDVIADDVPIFKPKGKPFWLATTAPESLEEVPWAGEGAHPLTERQARILGLLEGGPMQNEDLSSRFSDTPIASDVLELRDRGLVILEDGKVRKA